MNDDTEETWNWVSNEIDYQNILKPWIGNEIVFIDQLFGVILHINEQLSSANEIDLTKVNGNEVYIEFCELFGTGNEPH